MYQLHTGDYTNQSLYEKYKDKKEFVLNRYKDLDLLALTHIILNEQLNENIYKNITLSLTYGNELFNINKKQAMELYFALVVNYLHSLGEYPEKVRTVSQYKLLFKLTNGNVREFINQFQNFNVEPTYLTMRANHLNLFTECNLTWKIPIFFYQDKETRQKRVTLYHGTANFGFVKVGNLTEFIKVPRVMYLRFLADLPEVVNSTDTIRSAFDETLSNPLKDVLSYCGFNVVDRVEKNRELLFDYAEDNRLLVKALTNKVELDERFMKISYNTYYYLKENVLPFLQKHDIIVYEQN